MNPVPVEVEVHIVPHYKSLVNCKVEPRGPEHGDIYGSIIAGGLAISKNLSLESADIQAFVMERVPIVSDF